MAEPKVAGTKKKMRFSLPLWQRNVRYGEVDLAFFLIVIALLVMGIVMMFSASYAWAIAEGRDGTYYAVSQIKNAVVGLVIMCVLCLIDYHFLQKKFIAVCAYVLPILLLIMVFVPGIGVTDGGATRWIAIGSFNFQPSEVMKIGIVIFFSYVIEKNYANMRSFRKGLLPLLFAMAVPAALPHQGTAPFRYCSDCHDLHHSDLRGRRRYQAVSDPGRCGAGWGAAHRLFDVRTL